MCRLVDALSRGDFLSGPNIILPDTSARTLTGSPGTPHACSLVAISRNQLQCSVTCARCGHWSCRWGREAGWRSVAVRALGEASERERDWSSMRRAARSARLCEQLAADRARPAAKLKEVTE